MSTQGVDSQHLTDVQFPPQLAARTRAAPGCPVNTGTKCRWAARAHRGTSNPTGRIQTYDVYHRRRFQLSNLQEKRQHREYSHHGVHAGGYKPILVHPLRRIFSLELSKFPLPVVRRVCYRCQIATYEPPSPSQFLAGQRHIPQAVRGRTDNRVGD